MSLIGHTQGVPSRVLALVRLLAQARGNEVGRDEVVQMLSPPGLRKPGEPPGDQVRDAIGAATELRLVSVEEDKVKLEEGASRRRILTSDGLAEVALSRLLSGEVEDREFLRVASWFLEEDPYGQPLRWETAERSFAETYAGENFGLNNARFGIAAVWLVFLGLGRRVASNAYVPDPTAALAWLVPAFLPKKRRMALTAFCETLPVHAPVFEGGRWRKEVQAARQVPQDTARLGYTTSLALLELQDRGTVDLKMRKDGDAVLLRDATDATQSFTSIERMR